MQSRRGDPTNRLPFRYMFPFAESYCAQPLFAALCAGTCGLGAEACGGDAPEAAVAELFGTPGGCALR